MRNSGCIRSKSPAYEHGPVGQPGVLEPVAAAPAAIVGVALLAAVHRIDGEDRPVELDRKRAAPAAGVDEPLQDVTARQRRDFRWGICLGSGLGLLLAALGDQAALDVQALPIRRRIERGGHVDPLAGRQLGSRATACPPGRCCASCCRDRCRANSRWPSPPSTCRSAGRRRPEAGRARSRLPA